MDTYDYFLKIVPHSYKATFMREKYSDSFQYSINSRSGVRTIV